MNMRPYVWMLPAAHGNRAARRGSDSHDRSNALRPWSKVTEDTDVEAR